LAGQRSRSFSPGLDDLRPHASAVGHVKGYDVRGMTGLAQFLQARRQALAVAAVQQHAGASLGQALRHRPAEPAARARDQSGAAIEPELIGKGRHGTDRSSIARAS
jgi:hypothetical protein